MAFLSKVGNVLRQTVSKNLVADSSASRPSIYQALRCMSSAKLFVGGISYNTDEVGLREAFNKYGEVIEARVILDRETGRSRGFGFVTYNNAEDASSAIQALDGQDLHGRRIRVNYATDRARTTNYGGGYGGGNYGGGGYGGGNYGDGNYGGNNAGYPSRGYGPPGDSYGVGGGSGGSDNYNSGNISHGYNANSAPGFGGGDQFGVNQSSNFGGADGNDGFGLGGGEDGLNNSDNVDDASGQGEPYGANYRNDDDDTGDFAKRA